MGSNVDEALAKAVGEAKGAADAAWSGTSPGRLSMAAALRAALECSKTWARLASEASAGRCSGGFPPSKASRLEEASLRMGRAAGLLASSMDADSYMRERLVLCSLDCGWKLSALMGARPAAELEALAALDPIAESAGVFYAHARCGMPSIGADRELALIAGRGFLAGLSAVGGPLGAEAKNLVLSGVSGSHAGEPVPERLLDRGRLDLAIASKAARELPRGSNPGLLEDCVVVSDKAAALGCPYHNPLALYFDKAAFDGSISICEMAERAMAEAGASPAAALSSWRAAKAASEPAPAAARVPGA